MRRYRWRWHPPKREMVYGRFTVSRTWTPCRNSANSKDRADHGKWQFIVRTNCQLRRQQLCCDFCGTLNARRRVASEDETTTIISDVLNLAVIDLARVIPSRGSIGVVVVGLRSLRPLCKMKRKGCRRDLLLCDRRQSIESNRMWLGRWWRRWAFSLEVG